LIVTALTEALSSAIMDSVRGNAVDPFEAHECVRKLYTWQNVAERTELVYNLVSTTDEPSLINRLSGCVQQYDLLASIKQLFVLMLHFLAFSTSYGLRGSNVPCFIITAKAREYVFTGVGLCLCVCL